MNEIMFPCGVANDIVPEACCDSTLEIGVFCCDVGVGAQVVAESKVPSDVRVAAPERVHLMCSVSIAFREIPTPGNTELALRSIAQCG